MTHRLRALLSTIGLLALLVFAVYEGGHNPSLTVITGVAALAFSQTAASYLVGVLDSRTLRAERWIVPEAWIESPTPFAGTIIGLQGRFLLIRTENGGHMRVPAPMIFSTPTTIYDAKPPVKETA